MAGKRKPKCIILAGPNGAGKTTFAKAFLLQDAGIVNFINADMIATGLSPLKPERASRAAGRILLQELDRSTSTNASFALETTLSGRSYLGLFQQWKAMGYHLEMVFLKLDSPGLALNRIAMRVAQGGHDVPKDDVRRRFKRGWNNFMAHYRDLADRWWIYDGSGAVPVLLQRYP